MARPLRPLVVLLGLAAALGCGSSQAETDEVPPVQPICDGSSDLRVVFASIDGFGDRGGRFTDRYGGSYLVVDGTCRYWAGSGTLRGLSSGVLESDTASTLSEELHFGRYSTVAGYRDEQQCPDAGPAFLRDTTGTITSSFCGIEQAPRVVREALRRGAELARELADTGQAAWTKTSLLALRDPEVYPEVPSMRQASAWTSTLDLDARAMTSREFSRGLEPDAGVVVQDDANQELLGRLRRAELSKNPYASDLLVRDAQDRYFQLLVRDEPPDAVAAALLSVLDFE
jgi:hypothetical protein